MLELAVAYIDPGQGSLLIQVIIATILAVPYFMRTQLARLLKFIRKRDLSPSDNGKRGLERR